MAITGVDAGRRELLRSPFGALPDVPILSPGPVGNLPRRSAPAR